MADETPEQTRRWRVGKISDVLARAGLPEYKHNCFAAPTPFSDPIRDAGFTVTSREGDDDCVYAEWIDHWFSRGDNWRRGSARIIEALTASGYAGELLTVSSMNGYIRVTRPDHAT